MYPTFPTISEGSHQASVDDRHTSERFEFQDPVRDGSKEVPETSEDFRDITQGSSDGCIHMGVESPGSMVADQFGEDSDNDLLSKRERDGWNDFFLGPNRVSTGCPDSPGNDDDFQLTYVATTATAKDPNRDQEVEIHTEKEKRSSTRLLRDAYPEREAKPISNAVAMSISGQRTSASSTDEGSSSSYIDGTPVQFAQDTARSRIDMEEVLCTRGKVMSPSFTPSPLSPTKSNQSGVSPVAGSKQDGNQANPTEPNPTGGKDAEDIQAKMLARINALEAEKEQLKEALVKTEMGKGTMTGGQMLKALMQHRESPKLETGTIGEGKSVSSSSSRTLPLVTVTPLTSSDSTSSTVGTTNGGLTSFGASMGFANSLGGPSFGSSFRIAAGGTKPGAAGGRSYLNHRRGSVCILPTQMTQTGSLGGLGGGARGPLGSTSATDGTNPGGTDKPRSIMEMRRASFSIENRRASVSTDNSATVDAIRKLMEGQKEKIEADKLAAIQRERNPVKVLGTLGGTASFSRKSRIPKGSPSSRSVISVATIKEDESPSLGNAGLEPSLSADPTPKALKASKVMETGLISEDSSVKNTSSSRVTNTKQPVGKATNPSSMGFGNSLISSFNMNGGTASFGKKKQSEAPLLLSPDDNQT